MQSATDEEINKMMTKPCPDCGIDEYYYKCHGKDEAKTVGEKVCPVHNPSQLKKCCLLVPEEHINI